MWRESCAFLVPPASLFSKFFKRCTVHTFYLFFLLSLTMYVCSDDYVQRGGPYGHILYCFFPSCCCCCCFDRKKKAVQPTIIIRYWLKELLVGKCVSTRILSSSTRGEKMSVCRGGGGEDGGFCKRNEKKINNNFVCVCEMNFLGTLYSVIAPEKMV